MKRILKRNIIKDKYAYVLAGIMMMNFILAVSISDGIKLIYVILISSGLLIINLILFSVIKNYSRILRD